MIRNLKKSSATIKPHDNTDPNSRNGSIIQEIADDEVSPRISTISPNISLKDIDCAEKERANFGETLNDDFFKSELV